MRHLLPCLLATVALLLASCDSDQPREAPHAIMVQPAAPTVSAQQESIIAQGTQAAVDARVDAANLKAALAEEKLAQAAEKAATTEADRAAAAARYNAAVTEASAAKQAQAEAEARAMASEQEQAKQRKAELQGQADRFYWLACFLALAAGFMVYEKNLTCAGRLGVLAAGCAVLPSLVGGILTHELLIRNSIVLILLGEIIYHYRAKEKVLLGKLEAGAKATAIAVEHAMAHDFSAADAWMKTHHPIQEVEQLLGTAYSKIMTDAKLMAAKLHLIKAAAPVAQPAAPIAAIPVAPAAQPITVVRPLG